MNKITTVSEGLAHLPDGSAPIIIDSGAWFKLLLHIKSFRYVPTSQQPAFTARVEKSKYWYGYRRVKGKLHKVYIGQIPFPHQRLEEVAVMLNEPQKTRQKKEPEQSSVTELVATDEVTQLWQAINELRQEVKALRNLGDLLVTEENIESNEDELSTSEVQLVHPEAIDLERLVRLEEEIKRLREENIGLREELSSPISQGDSDENEGLCQQIIDLKLENKRLNTELDDLSRRLNRELDYNNYLDDVIIAGQWMKSCEVARELVMEKLKIKKQSLAEKAIDEFISAMKSDFEERLDDPADTL